MTASFVCMSHSAMIKSATATATATMKLSTAAIKSFMEEHKDIHPYNCLLYTSPSPRD